MRHISIIVDLRGEIMDLRVKRTRSNIINAFLKLRSSKPLEKITIKELSEEAQINKATFYLHYKDIYDLSDYLENEIIENIMSNIEHPDTVVSNPKRFVMELAYAFYSNHSLIDIVFSGRQQNSLIDGIEHRIKTLVFEKYPEYADSSEMDIMLTYQIKGGYYAFISNIDTNTDELLAVIGDISEKITRISIDKLRAARDNNIKNDGN